MDNKTFQKLTTIKREAEAGTAQHSTRTVRHLRKIEIPKWPLLVHIFFAWSPLYQKG